ncbi:MAG: T9SS type A sorting domain-containing protein [Bacteroidia bacterium]|nr:T9SS type A sorting domain-containing protein [Bacteroidia bacterium]MDW8157358.1 T9SS type A sorting domain-containing protein [Bacteroidia bacterium]
MQLYFAQWHQILSILLCAITILWCKGLHNRAFAQSGQDCDSAIWVQAREITVNYAPRGWGKIKDIPAGVTCLETGEQNSHWYLLNIVQGGTLGFELFSFEEDYDFALYRIGQQGCATIFTQIPLRCNYSYATGRTGLDSSWVTNQPLSYGYRDPALMPGIIVNAGEVYLLLLTRLEPNSNGYRLRFTGTARVHPPRSGPSILAADAPRCAPTDTHEVVLHFNQELDCSTLKREYISITPPQGQTLQVLGVSCTNAPKGQIRLRYFTSTASSGRYIFRYQAPAEQGLRSADNFRRDTISFAYQVSQRPTAEFIVSSNRICLGENTTIQYVGNAGSTATFSWDIEAGATSLPIAGVRQGYRIQWNTPGIKTISLSVSEGNCFSTLFSQIVTVYPITPIIQGNTRCGSGPLTITLLLPGLQQCTLRLFDAPAGGNLIAISTNLTNAQYSFRLPSLSTSTTFFLEGECSDIRCSALGAVRQRIPVNILEAPPPPVILSQKAQQCGSGVVVVEVQPNLPFSLFLTAYADSLAPTSIPFERPILEPHTLIFRHILDSLAVYISQWHPITNCESTRKKVVLKSIPIPSPPQISTRIQICGPQTVTLSPLMGRIRGEGIKLFSSCQIQITNPFTGDNALITDTIPPYTLQTPIITTTTTFALATFSRGSDFPCSGGICPPCYSECSFVVIDVLPIPQLPTIDSIISVCQGELLNYALKEVAPGTIINVYKNIQPSNPFLQVTGPPYVIRLPLEQGDTILYFEAQQGNNPQYNCRSNRKKVQIQFLKRPPQPEVAVQPRCGFGKVSLTVLSSFEKPAYTYVGLSNPALIARDSSEQKLWRTSILVPNQESITWFAFTRDKQNGCQSSPILFSVPIHPIPPAPDSLGALRLNNGHYLLFWHKVEQANAYEYAYRIRDTPWSNIIRTDTNVVVLSNYIEGQTYEFRVRSLCKDTFSNFSVIYTFRTEPNFLPKNNLELNVSIFPNPAQNYFWLEIPSSSQLNSITLIDRLGKVISSKLELEEEQKNLLKFRLPSLSPGIYILSLNLDKSRKFIPLIVSQN